MTSILQFRRSVALCLVISSSLVLAAADTITQTNAEGKRMVIQTNAIITQNNSDAVIFKHFDLKQRRVVREKLDQGSLPYSVVLSSASARRQIVALWKEFGYTASVITQSGKKMRVYDAYIDFFPGPGGIGSFLESVPPRTNLPLLLDGGGADQIEFDHIADIESHGGHLTVTRISGKVESGKFLMPTKQPAVAHFMGITDAYNPSSPRVYDFSLPLRAIKAIRFRHDN